MKYLKMIRLQTIVSFFIAIPSFIKKAMDSVLELASLFALIVVLIVVRLIYYLVGLNFLPFEIRKRLLLVNEKLQRLIMKFNVVEKGTISRLELFDLAFKNMLFKRTRTLITVGGMALGVGSIVFLVSLGYGLQKLVIDRVASLDELKQADVAVQPGSNVKLRDDVLEDFRSIENVEDALPLIGVVAKINYQGSVSDVAVYGVTTKYLEHSAISTIAGTLFNEPNIDFSLGKNIQFETSQETSESTISSKDWSISPQIQGISVAMVDKKIGDFSRDIKFSIYPKTWVEVREDPDPESKLVGYTKNSGFSVGEEVYGKDYFPLPDNVQVKNSEGNLGLWVNDTVLLWQKKEWFECSQMQDCVDESYVPVSDGNGNQLELDGYINETSMMVTDLNSFETEVLGTTTENDSNVIATDSSDSSESADLKWLETTMESSQSAEAKESASKVLMPQSAKREAVVNQALLRLLGFTDNSIGKVFNVSYVSTSEAVGNTASKIETVDSEYKIVAVVQGDSVPFFYVPINDLRAIGLVDSSQIKIVAVNKESLSAVREKVSSMGFVSNSVADTVLQINSLFGTVRLMLGILGTVALGVAALGMFNTLTVSLLERTREVGLMKAMGMSSVEVKRLFLTESMLMGFMGGD